MRLFVESIGKHAGNAFIKITCAITLFFVSSLTFSATASAQTGPKAPIVKPGAPGKPGVHITPQQSVEMGQSRYTDADVNFMQMMIIHHAQAVEMGALIADRTGHKGVNLMGQRIATSQTSEIEMMRTWLRRRGQALEPDMAHAHHSGHAMNMSDDPDVPLMHGMLSRTQMKALAAARGTDFDRQFLSGMIEHHEGAIDMVNSLEAVPGAGEDPEISDFLASIVADQSTEILRMRSMLNALPVQ